jgi:hypothetical protein
VNYSYILYSIIPAPNPAKNLNTKHEQSGSVGKSLEC